MLGIWKRKIKGRLAITSLAITLLLSLTAAQAMAQDGAPTFSQDVPEQTITFSTLNPYTKTSGSMTITFSGVFHATRLTEPTGSQRSRITGGQRGTFTFIPDDPSQPTISGKFRFGLEGRTQPNTGVIQFAFKMDGMTQDGSMVTFVQTERVVISEESVAISFGKTDRVAAQQAN